MGTIEEASLFREFINFRLFEEDGDAFKKGLRATGRNIDAYSFYSKSDTYVEEAFNWKATPHHGLTWDTINMLWKRRLFEFRGKIKDLYDDDIQSPAISKCKSIW